MSSEIGYRRPPPDKQFKKGASGNPKGRPKGSKNFVKLLEDELSATITVNENGKKKKITRREAMVKKLVAGALAGDPKQFLLMIDVMRRTGQLTDPEPDNLLPDDYETLIAEHMAKHQPSTPSSP